MNLKKYFRTVVVMIVLFPSLVFGEIVTEEWVRQYDGVPRGLAIDAMSNVYVTGSSATIKYDTNGNELWVKRDNGDAYSFIVDSIGNIYVLGGGWYYNKI
ncbi:MAG: hypothetical protein HZB79_03565 [Deltaproteobacteria bacterium]|nr:hypothetical protein [Deltaproteobacteria bacterium]